MNWKDKLELKYGVETDVWQQIKTLTLFCWWRGYLVIRKCVTVNLKDYKYKDLELLLRQWFDDYVLNYEDLTKRQKRRIKDFPFVAATDAPTHRRYCVSYDYIDSEYLDYAKIKMIRVRVNYIKGETSGYQVRPKSVICELLQET